MNILLAADNNFVQHCCVTMTSVLENNKGVVFYLFTEGLSADNLSLLEAQVKKYGGELHICCVDKQAVASFPMPPEGGNHISIATYYRLFAALLLPADVKRIIYMDCDIVVRGSLEELWNEDLDNYALGAVYQPEIEGGIITRQRLSIPEGYGYFNAGVLLFNLDYWRKKKVTERLFGFIQDHHDCIRQHDQDVLNAVLYAETLALNRIWNYLPIFFVDLTKMYFRPPKIDSHVYPQPVVIHFVSLPKPWEYGSYNPYTYEYFYYLDRTPYAGWRPKFNSRRWWEHVGKPMFRKLLIKVDFLKLRKLFA